MNLSSYAGMKNIESLSLLPNMIQENTGLDEAIRQVQFDQPLPPTVQLETINGNSSNVVERDRDDTEKLRMIKARTMFEMVEDFDDGLKILFVTNPQASLIASSESTTINNMFNALELDKPSLVINLLMSYGFAEGVRLWPPEDITVMREQGRLAGVMGGRAPFLSPGDEYSAESRVDIFMSEVLIPLAAKNNALVMCDAVSRKCLLSRSFMRMTTVCRARWGGRLPFTIISVVTDVMALYRNFDESAHWRYLRSRSRAWQQRDSKIHEVANRTKQGTEVVDGIHDIDHNTTCLLVADNIDPEKDTVDPEAITRLRDAMLRQLSSVPTISIKTGMSVKNRLGQSSAETMQRPSDLAQNGQLVLFLDVRPRDGEQFAVAKASRPVGTPQPLLQEFEPTPHSHPGACTRAELIEYGKKHLNDWCDQLLKLGLAETLDVCSLAFMRDCLFGDGTKMNVLGEPTTIGTPLHEAICLARLGQSTKKHPKGKGTAIPPRQASLEEVAEVAEWLTHRIFNDAWQLVDDREDKEAQGEDYRSSWKTLILAQNIYMRSLLSSPNFHHANLYDMDGARRLINRLVCLESLPVENPLEGLLLLRSAWCDYDVAMLLAGRYKLVCKTLFALQLLLGLLVILGSSLSNASDDEDFSDTLLRIAFAISLAISFLVSLDGQLNPKSRWRQLRSCASSLQSIIWQYRTRVGPFELAENCRDSTQSEVELCNYLNDWRDNLISSAGLRETALKREYPARVFCHFQDKGVLEDGEDDFQSPTQPARYISRRVQVSLAFYKKRIPIYSRRNTIFKITVALLGIASSYLAHMKEPMWVAIATAFAGTIMSWSEFSDSSQKVERYSKSINGLEKVLSWWDSLSEVQKASKDSITRLVTSCEAIITEEMLSWTTAGNKQKSKEGKEVEEDGDSEDKSKSAGA